MKREMICNTPKLDELYRTCPAEFEATDGQRYHVKACSFEEPPPDDDGKEQIPGMTVWLEDGTIMGIEETDIKYVCKHGFLQAPRLKQQR